jgi:ADP-ribose pyrophosphatase
MIHQGKVFGVERRTWTDSRGNALQKDIVRHPGAVLVVPVLDADRIVMIRNHRVAVDQRLWEFPAGTLNAGEPPAVAAARELEEETGYRAASISPLAEFYTSPGFADERMHAFVAERLEQVGQRLEAGEDIEVAVVAVEQALRMADEGELEDGKSIVALLLWSRRVADRNVAALRRHTLHTLGPLDPS